jgi:acetoin utilization protein AcuC
MAAISIRAPGAGDGHGDAVGTKLNLPPPPGATDSDFSRPGSVSRISARPATRFHPVQCGADSLEGDPITHLAFTEEAHGAAARALCRIADDLGHGRVLGMGGGGYNRRNIARAWTRVVESFVAAQGPR